VSGIWTRTLVYLGLREEPEDAVDWDVLEAADPAPRETGQSRDPRRRATGEDVSRSAPRGVMEPGAERHSRVEESNVRQIRSSTAERTAVVQVRVFDDAEAVGSRYRQRQAVLFDVSGCPKEVARRVVDFVSGLTYASRGRLSRVAPRVFLLLPDGVDLADDERRRLSGLGYELGGAGSGGTTR